MTAVYFLAALVLVFALAWRYLSRNPHPRAKLGPDGTNVREPETFVVHHEGKGQGIDIANTALKERTEDLKRDLPGDTHKIKAPVPGRDTIRLNEPPSDVSKFGDVKVAPGAEPKDKVLMEGPIGSRPGTPEEPGSPYAKGRRVTDNHRDVELAADLLPNLEAGPRSDTKREMAASPSTNGQEPGYGLGRTAPGETDGEGGFGDPHLANATEAHTTDTRRSEGGAAGVERRRGRVIQFRARPGGNAETDEAIAFQPDPVWAHEMAEELDWSGLHDEFPLPEHYGEDALTALVRNPRSLYVCWDRTGFGEENLQTMVGEDEYKSTVPCLRVYDLDSGAYPGQPGGHVQTIDVGEHDNHWFINHGIEPGRHYIVSFERRTAGGRSYLFSHSGPLATPHDSPAPYATGPFTGHLTTGQFMGPAGSRVGLLYQRYVGTPGGSGTSWR